MGIAFITICKAWRTVLSTLSMLCGFVRFLSFTFTEQQTDPGRMSKEVAEPALYRGLSSLFFVASDASDRQHD